MTALSIAAALAQAMSDVAGPRLVEAAFVLLIALQGWNLKATTSTAKELAVIRQHLFGAKGNNGLTSDVGKTRRRVHKIAGAAHSLLGRHVLLADRVGALDGKAEPPLVMDAFGADEEA